VNAIFISVRTGSSRLPKKALYEIQGKTTIEYLIDRLKKSKYAEKVILCTTQLKEDDILCDIAGINDIDYFRGSSPDKLMRWLGATEKYNVDFFVNVDGDDIFFDAGLADICFKQQSYFYTKDWPEVDFIDGQGLYNDVYGVKTSALQLVCELKQSNNTEFVKPFFYNIKDKINIQKIKDAPGLWRLPGKYYKRKMRLTLDYEEDFLFFKTVIEHFLNNDKELEFEDILNFIEKNPDVSEINWHREQDWKENQEKKMKERVVYHTGKWVPISKAGIHIYDSQSFFGDGIFEMVRTFNQEFFILDKHIDRLFRSANYLQIPISKTKREIIDLCKETLERNKEHFPEGEECRLYINASRGPLPMYSEVFDKIESTLIIDAWPLSKTAKSLGHFYKTGVNAVVPVQRQIPARLLENKVKNVSRMHYQVANLEVANFNSDRDVMPLLIDEDGFVAESTGANFIMIEKGKIVTPELRNLLRGESMMYIIETLAPQLRIEVIHKNFDLYDVMNCDEAMFTGTFVNLLPCNRLNGKYINDNLKENPLGPITKKIADKWSQNVGVDFIEQMKYWHQDTGTEDGFLSSLLGDK